MTTAVVKKAKAGTVLVTAEMYAVIRETKKGHVKVDLMLRLPKPSQQGLVRLCRRTFYAYGHTGYRSQDAQRWAEAEAWANARLYALSTGPRRQFLYLTGAQN